MQKLSLDSILFQTLLMTVLLLTAACKDNQRSIESVETPETKPTNMPENSTDNAAPVILCFGNSLTAGYGLEEDQAWPALLQDRLDSLNYEYEVVNAGLSGETTSGGLNRIEWVLNREVDIFILELGANDMLRGLSVENTKDNLIAILDIVLAKNPDTQIIIAGMMSPPNMGPEYENKFNKIFPDLARRYNAELIPFFLEGVASIEELNLPDGKHPNIEGQKIVLMNVWRALGTILEKQ